MRRLLPLLGLMVGLPVSGYSQSSPPAQAAGPGDTVLHVGTQLVVVDVIVRDKNNQPVHGLKRDDFILSESKAPQTLRGFDEFATNPVQPAAVPPMPKLPPGNFTNYTPVPTSGPLNVLLIDGLNTPLADQSYVRLQLAEYAKHVAPGTRIAILGLGTQLYFLQGFSSDPRVLQASLANIKTGRSSPLVNTPGSPVSNEALMDSLTDPNAPAGSSITSGGGSAIMTSSAATFVEQIGVAQTASRIQLSIEGFTALAHWLANFPGRKNVIWFSASFPLGVVPNASIQNNTDIPGEDSDEFRAMTNLLTKAQVSIYPVDPRGVQTDPGFQAANTSPNQITAARTASQNFYGNQAAEHSTMQAIAADTGGEPFYNRNDLSKAVTDAINSGANYYTLAYTPNEKKTGGEYRSIQIKLTGDAAGRGLHLSYRQGYFADNLKVPAHRTGTAETTTAAFTPIAAARTYVAAAKAHGAPLPTDILFTSRVLPHSTDEEELVAKDNVLNPKDPLKPPYRRYDVDALALTHYFTLTKQPDGNYAGGVQLAAFVYSSDGKLLNEAARQLSFNLTPDAYARLQKENVGVHLEISAPVKGETYLRIAFQDMPSNRIGAVELPLASVSNLPPIPK